MAVWNEKYYKGNDVYSDGSIEDEILDIVCRDDYEEKKDELIGNNYTIAYHLTPIRENILNWYPFTKEQSAIEIGAGCGAITGMLCRKLGKVVSVDLSRRRSKINYERHKQYDNLEIIIGNFNDMELGEQYDYVVLNGVFEYAISFTESDRPYHDFLHHISRFLKPDGKFLISIENKLGLKYFNGAKEDHTGNYFLGLNEYVGNKTVRTFSKSELEDILADEGYKYTKFYYPYPDYKFPNEIFTEESMGTNQYGRPFINIEDDRYWLFDENAVGKSLLKENVRNIFANSFLVEASKEEFKSEVVYAKLNVERKPEFQIGTSIVDRNSKKNVIKYAIHPFAQKHIDNVAMNTKITGKEVNYLPAYESKDGIQFDFLYTENLDSSILKYINEKDVSSVLKTMKQFFEVYLEEFLETEVTSDFYTNTFKEYFGEHQTNQTYLCVKRANIDVIMDNIYQIENRYLLIDGEWIYPEWIPYAFIQWRAINELYSKHNQLETLISRRELLKLYGISQEDETLFHAWAVHFANHYVGSSSRERWAKMIQNISIDEIHQELRSNRIANMSLYIDAGNGFSEENKLFQDVNIENNEFEVTFISEQLRGAKQLRFDPIEGKICILKIENLSSGCIVSGDNCCEEVGDGKLFINLDPQIYIQVNEEIESITIKATFKVIQKEALVKCLQEINDKRLMLGAHVVNVENRVQELFENLGKNEHELAICKDTIIEQHNLREQLNLEIKQKDTMISELMRERDFYFAENEKHAYIANSTKTFLKRKIKIKLNQVLEKMKK